MIRYLIFIAAIICTFYFFQWYNKKNISETHLVPSSSTQVEMNINKKPIDVSVPSIGYYFDGKEWRCSVCGRVLNKTGNEPIWFFLIGLLLGLIPTALLLPWGKIL